MTFRKKLLPMTGILALAPILGGADGDGCSTPTAEQKQSRQQQQLMGEGLAQTGMPSIKNFRERKLLKDIYELRDQNGLVTYTYLYNQMTGALVFFCNSVGYGIPYATEYTNPQQDTYYTSGSSVHLTIPQADPNGLYSPSSAEGTWVMCAPPNGGDAQPVYVEPRVIVSPFALK